MANIPKKSILKRTQIIEKKRIVAEKARQEELDENICVIGYASKLFRDNAKALSIHRGEHLIPWQGDTSLMIDRYDVRGHLQELNDFQTDSWNKEYKLSSEEERIESLCDEERYLALHKDLIDEQHRQEEELKRLNEAIACDDGYNAVGFSYGGGGTDGNTEYDPMNPTEDETETRQENTPPAPEAEAERAATPEPDEEPFIAPDELNVPKGVERPATVKTHQIIEKTAMFVAGQGTQMEIIVKAKQSNNPQFSFLSFEHYLNPYYKHLVKMIKSKRYRPKPLAPMDQNKGRGARRSRSNSGSSHHSDDEDDLENSGYLHPSLLGKSKTVSATKTTDIKSSTNEVASAAATAAAAAVATTESSYSSTTAPANSNDNDYRIDPRIQALMAYMDPASLAAAGYYDPATGMVNPYLLQHLPPPPPPPDGSDPNAPPYMPYLDPSYMSAPPPPPPHSAAVPLNTALPPHATVPPPPNVTGPPPPIHTGPPPPIVVSGPPPPIVTHPPPIVSHPPPTPVPPDTSIPPPPVMPPAALPGVASQQHTVPVTTAASEPSKVEAANIIPPPPDIQPIIDKLAKYVAKNGEDFEVSVRTKADQRFEFLLPWHPFNAYYMQKKRLYLKEMGKDVGKLDESLEAQSNVKKAGPVSFSIKPKRADERDLEKKSALPIESSDSDEEEEMMRRQSSKRTAAMNLPGFGAKDQKGLMPEDGSPEDWRDRYPNDDVPPADYGQSQFPVPLPDDQSRKLPIPPEELAFRNSKHKLQDRLAMAARDKMANESKERVLQMERRKKAALFLNMIKDRPQAAETADSSNDITDVGSISPMEVIDLVDDHDDYLEGAMGYDDDDESRPQRRRHSRSASPTSHHHHRHRHKHRHGGDTSSSKAYKKIRNRDTDNDGKSRRRARSKSPASKLSNNSSPTRKRRLTSRTPSPQRMPTPQRSQSLGPEYTQDRSESQSPSSDYADYPDASSRLESPPPVEEIDLTSSGDAADYSHMPSSEDPQPTDLRSKVRAMLAATRGMVFEPT